MKTPLRLLELISGSGTTADAINAACHNGGPLFGKIQPVLVIASRPDADGLAKTKARGVPTLVIPPSQPAEQFGEQILIACRDWSVDLIGQYGWHPLTPANVIDAFPDRMINQHPAPVPEFGGLGMFGRRVHCARLLYARQVKRDYWTMAIAQRVAPEFDAGAVLHGRVVKILPDDDPISLQQRVLPIEHQVQIEMLTMVFEGTVREAMSHLPLVRDIVEKMMLNECKRTARLLFPHG